MEMIELIYFSEFEDVKKTYHLIQSRRGEPWQIVDGDELIGTMDNQQGLWSLDCWEEVPHGMCSGLVRLIESQHFNRLPQEIKSHWPGKVLEVVVKNDAEYLVICKPGVDLEQFIRIFSAYVPHLLKDEWAIVFHIYNASMSEDIQLSVQKGKV